MRKNWTPEEVEFLEENWGVISIPGICKKLGRSESSVTNKVTRLGLGSHTDAGDLITLRKLMIALGQKNDYDHFKNKYANAGLKITYKTINTKKIAKVRINEFWKWAKKNKNILNFARFEKGDLGKEPDWVGEKRKADRMNPTKLNSKKVWTIEEDNRLISKVKSCRYTYKDLAEELNRTECAIKKRLSDLKVPYRPIPRDNHIMWTEEEKQKVIELYKKGYDTCAIAKVLGKSQLCITEKLREMEV